ncbi:MAG: lipopolysaccharide kinase InaA family protein, partial [Gemmatimonadales bacterium]
APTRAPRELANALRLAKAGVPTPEVVAYAVYPAMRLFARSDVVTRLVAGAPFPEAWRGAAAGQPRLEIVRALAQLLRTLREAGALHPDLNLRNVLVTTSASGPIACVLDVDRIEFGEPRSNTIGRRNLARVLRSARKWHRAWGVDLDNHDTAHVLAESLLSAPPRRPS